MSDKDFKSLFKAAKSARGGTQKLSKEQIKALKAQRAAALAAQEAERPAEPASGQGAGADIDASSMPPPPPRQPSTKPPQHSVASYHADSQATRLYNGSTAVPSAHPEPSVNQGPGGGTLHLASRSNALPSEEVRSSHPEGLPAGFFQTGAVSAAASNLPEAEAAEPLLQQQQQQQQGPTATAAADAAGALLLQAEAAISLEGSTGAVAGGTGGAADLTSALSSQYRPLTAPRAQPSAVSGVPAGFFEEAPVALSVAEAGVVSSPAAEQPAGEGAAAGSALPKGFFQDKAADAKARGEVPMSKKDLDKEFADFLKQVDTDAAEAAAKKAAEDAEEAADKQDREEFEHIVRLQRIEELKRAKAAGAAQQAPTDELVASAAAAVSNPEVSMPAIQLPKKRKVADTLAELERDSMSEGESDEEEEPLDWRAKKSAF